MGVPEIEPRTRASGGQSSLSVGQAQSLPPYGIAPACAVRLGSASGGVRERSRAPPSCGHLAGGDRRSRDRKRNGAVIVPLPSKFSVELRDLVRQARWLVREARPRQAGRPHEGLAARPARRLAACAARAPGATPRFAIARMCSPPLRPREHVAPRTSASLAERSTLGHAFSPRSHDARRRVCRRCHRLDVRAGVPCG